MPRRLSPAEQEVQDYITEAQAGRAGVNPQAQTLARSSNPYVARQGQRAVDQQLDNNARNVDAFAKDTEREAIRMGKEQERAAKQAATDATKAAAAEQARAVREGAAAGVQTVTDIETGKRSLATRPDGSAIYKPGEVGTPQPMAAPTNDPTQPSPVVGMQQTFRNDRGETKSQALETKTDKATGAITVPGKDSFGAPTENVVGIDPAVAQKQQRIGQLEQESASNDLRRIQLQQARAHFEPRFQPVKAEFTDAKQKLESLANNYVQEPNPKQGQPARWGEYGTGGQWKPLLNPGKDDRFLRWQQDMADAKRRVENATKQYQPLAGQAENLTKAERDARMGWLNNRAEKIRIERGLPDDDGGISMTLARAEDPSIGDPHEDAINEVIGASPTAQSEDQAVSRETTDQLLSGSPAAPTGQGVAAPATPAVQDAFKSLQGLQGVTVEPFNDYLTNLNRNGAWIGSLQKTKGGSIVTLRDTAREQEDILQIVKDTEAGIPIYLRDNQNRQDPTEEATKVAGAFQTMQDPSLAGDPQAIAKTLASQGLDPMTIRKAVDTGEMSVQSGKTLLKNLWGDSLEADNFDDPANFQKWLEETSKPMGNSPFTPAKRWQKAISKDGIPGVTSSFSLDDQAAIKMDYARDYALKNAGKPGVDRATIRGLYAKAATASGGRVASAANGLRNIVVNDVIGSMMGLAGGAVADLGAAEAAFLGSEDGKKALEESKRMRGRDWSNWKNAAGRNAKAWGTSEGRAISKELENSLRDLKSTIDSEADSATPDKAKIDAAEMRVRESALALHNLNPDTSWPVTSDTLDPNKDATLGGALGDYKATADPRAFALFSERLLMNNGRRQLSAEIMRKNGNQSGFFQAVQGATRAGWQEIGSELVADAAMLVTGGGSKALQMGLRGAGAAGKAARVESAAAKISRALETAWDVGIKRETLQKPLGAIDKTMNAGVRAVQGAVGEGAEEVIVSPGDDTPTPLNDFLVGMLGTVTLAPAAAAVSAIRSNSPTPATVTPAVQARNESFTTRYNAENAGTAGFSPVTPEIVGTARDFVSPQDHAQTVKGIADLQKQHAAITGTDEAATNQRAQIRQQAEQSIGSLVTRQDDSIQAARSIAETADPARRTFLTGIAKVAAGNEASLTANERKAIQGATTQSGADYFEGIQQPDGTFRETITREAAEELAATAPAVARLISTPTTQSNVQQLQPQVEGSGAVPVSQEAQPQVSAPEPGPTGMGAETTGGGEAPLGGTAEAPALTVEADPFIPTAEDADALQAELEAELAGETTPANETNPPETLNPPEGLKAGEQSQPAPTLAEAAIQRAQSRFPNVAANFAIDDQATGQTGGASAKGGIITIHRGDLEKELAGFDPTKHAERLDAILDEEIVHLAQFEAAKRMNADVTKFYDSLWNEFTPEQQQAAAETYQASFDKQENWQKAAETVRMLVQAHTDGKVTELTKAFSKNMPARLVEMLKHAVEFLKSVIEGGEVSQRIQDTIDRIETVLAEYAAIEETTTPATDDTGGKSTQGIQESTKPNSDQATVEGGTGNAPSSAESSAEPDVPSEVTKKPNLGRQIDSPARREAFALLRDGETEYIILAKILGTGKITPPPANLALIKKKQKDAKKLTNSEIKTLEDVKGQYDSVIFKNQLSNTKEGKIAQAALGLIMARQGEGITPNKMAGAIKDGWTADQLWLAIREDLGRMSRPRKESADDPNRQTKPTAAEITKAESKAVDPEKQAAEFEAANQPGAGTKALSVEDFTTEMEGQYVTVDGERMMIASVDWNSFLDQPNSITLQDGTRFGRQVLEDGEIVYAEEDPSEEPRNAKVATPAKESAQNTPEPAVSEQKPAQQETAEPANPPQGNAVGGWQTRNSRLGEAFAIAKRPVTEMEGRISAAIRKDSVTLPPGYDTFPDATAEGMVVLTDDMGNDIRYPLTMEEAATEAWKLHGGNQFELSDKLAKKLKPKLDEARAAMKAASDAWTANGKNPDAAKYAAEDAAAAEVEMKKREAISKAAKTREAKKASKQTPSPAPTSAQTTKPAQASAKDAGGESLKSSATDTSNLVAVHNLSIDNLKNVLRLGGLPVPSLAVIRADKSSFDNFGEITLVASPDLVDPQSNRQSKVFNADVYSPRYPQITTILKPGDGKKLSDSFDKFRDETLDAIPAGASYSWNPDQIVGSINSDGYSSLKYNPLVNYAFLRSKGEIKPPKKGVNDYDFRSMMTKKISGRDGELESWINDHIDRLGIVPDEKIFNGFTYSGNRRYLPHNLDTVVKLLKKGLKDGEGFNFGVPSIRATSAKQFRTLKQIQQSRDHIVTTEEMEALTNEVNDEFSRLSDEILPYRANTRDGFGALDALSDDFKSMAQGGGANMRHLREMYPGDDAGTTVFKPMREFLEKLKNMPTEYFEAKIQRAVQLNEFEGAVVPKKTPENLIAELKRRGISVVTYPDGNKEARAKAVMSMSKASNALFSSPTQATPSPAFYSRLSEAVNQAPMGTSKAKQPMQWKGVILKWAEGRMSAGGALWSKGIAKEELKWSGILTWLDAQRQPLTKPQLLAYLADEGAVRFEEVELAGKPTPLSRDQFDALPEAEQDRLANATDRTKYGQYVLPGGTNYREIVLAMPVEAATTGFEIIKKGRSIGTFGTRDAVDRYLEQIGETEGEGVTVRTKQTAEDRERTVTYTSGHFPDVPNYVAHIRLNERDGGLFIEELQSDRHQAGRKQGYKDGASKDSPAQRFFGKNYEELDTAKKAVVDNYINEYGNAASEDGKVADAPFRTTWPLALFKRALRDAVASGKEWIGWTTGETQNSRFDLSKQARSIVWSPYERRGYSKLVTIEQNEGNTIELPVTDAGIVIEGIGTQFDGKRLDDVVGKDIAEKILNEKRGDLSGDGLKVGGSGMKGFYDNMLPKEIEKYVKQWGGKVEQSSIHTDGPKYGIIGDQRGLATTARNMTEALEAVEKSKEKWPGENFTIEERGTPIWRINITPAMREGVSQGQALFSSPTRRKDTQTPDLFAAVNAPDAAAKLGDVKAGRMHALNAYKTLTAKRDKVGLSTGEEQQLLDAETALGQKLAFDMESVKGEAPAVVKESLTTPAPAFGSNTRQVQDEMSRAGEIDRKGQISLFSSASINEAVKDARKELDALRKSRNEATISFAESETESGPVWDAVLPKDYFGEVPSIYENDGTYTIGESLTEYPSLEQAKDELTKRIRAEYKDQGGTFGSDMDGQRITGDIFSVFPDFPSITKPWEQTKWGSWYLEFRDDEGNRQKISVRDHGATRADMGLPARSFYVSKQWNPEEVGSALQKAADYVEENSPARAADATDMQSRETASGSESRQSLGGNEAQTVTDPQGNSVTLQASPTRRKDTQTPDLFAAVNAPDAAAKLGDVKAGRMHALNAYKTLTAKRDKVGLSTGEEQQLLDAETALGQKLAFDMDAVKGNAPAVVQQSLTTPRPVSGQQPLSEWMQENVKPQWNEEQARLMRNIQEKKNVFGQNRRDTQDEMSRNGEIDKSGQISLLSSATPDPSTVIDWKKFPPTFKLVYAATLEGKSLPQIAKELRIPDKAVTNILNQINTRVQALSEAEDGKLKPKMKDGLIERGRPERALSTTSPEVARILQIRQDNGDPETIANAETYESARKMIAKDYQGTIERIVNRRANGEDLTLDEVAAAQMILLGKVGKKRSQMTPEEKVQLGWLAMDWVEQGTDDARRLQIRRDVTHSPAERAALYFAKELYTPQDKATVDALKNAKGRAAKEQVMKRFMERSEGLKARLKERGIDLEASLEEFRRQQDEKQAMEEAVKQAHDRLTGAYQDEVNSLQEKLTKANEATAAAQEVGIASEAQIATMKAEAEAMAEKLKKSREDLSKVRMLEPGLVLRTALLKLTDAEKAAMETLLNRGTIENALAVGGMTQDALKKVYTNFGSVLKKARLEAQALAKQRMLEMPPVLMSSAMEADELRMVGYVPWGELETRKAPITPEQVRQKPKKQPKEKPAEPVTLTPEQQAAIDAAFEEFKAADPSTWSAWWQETAAKLTPMIGQTSFEQFKERVMQPWKDRWQTEMDGIANPSARITFDEWIAKPSTKETAKRERDLFPQPINETTGTWNNTRPYTSQGELIREEISTTTGLLDFNDPISVRNALREISTGRSSTMDRVMEWWRASILSGPQTAIVNTTSNFAFGTYNAIPRRMMEAAVNGTLKLVGLGSNDNASFGEFASMAKHLQGAASLAARKAVESWNQESANFKAYALATENQLNFGGKNWEDFEPALPGKIGTFMRSISFRHMQAADEFGKFFFGQIEVAAQAYRIAKAEGLAGNTREARIAELIENNGSEAWKRTYEIMLQNTFQEKLVPLGDSTSAIRVFDTLALKAKDLRTMPYLGRPVTFFLPFIMTPTNIAKQAVEISPLGGVMALIDGSRALKRRLSAGKLNSDGMRISKEEAKLAADQLYDKARFVRDFTNQVIAWSIYFTLAELVAGDDDDDLPLITGTMAYTLTKRGERDVAERVMPPQSIRIPGTNTFMSYSRMDPFATVLAGMVDMTRSLNREGGFNSKVATDFLSHTKNAMKDKTFLQGVSNLINALEEPSRVLERLSAGIITGFVPNLIRQPIREADPMKRDMNPREDDGLAMSIAKRLGYSIVPSSAPLKIDVWGNEMPANTGEMIGGHPVANAIFRALDPTNLTVGAKFDPLDLYIFTWNNEAQDTDKISVMPIDDFVTATVNGKSTKLPLTAQEQTEANRNVGRAAHEFLSGAGLDHRSTSKEGAEAITDIFRRLQRSERERLRIEKLSALSE